LLSQVRVAAPERALRNLKAISGCLPPAVTASLPNLLADSPDPDGALNLFERLCHGASPELLALLRQYSFLPHYAMLVFGYSPYLGDTLITSPDLFVTLARRAELERTWSRDEYEHLLRGWLAQQESAGPEALALFKRRCYIRILLRDVLGIATMSETAAEISALADAAIAHSLQSAEVSLRRRLNMPEQNGSTPLAVLGLGKIGGNELNYSSDVDLLFLYDDEASVAAPISAREYFIRLAQEVTEQLSQPTAEGPVFRIDLRLRPQGREGEPAIGLRAAWSRTSISAN
jgi:glutamate-ammonia-ligase adenylyltransferase